MALLLPLQILLWSIQRGLLLVLYQLWLKRNEKSEKEVRRYFLPHCCVTNHKHSVLKQDVWVISPDTEPLRTRSSMDAVNPYQQRLCAQSKLIWGCCWQILRSCNCRTETCIFLIVVPLLAREISQCGMGSVYFPTEGIMQVGIRIKILTATPWLKED